mgnify:CR=1 FL=1
MSDDDDLMALLGGGDNDEFTFDAPTVPKEILIGKEVLELGQRVCDLIKDKKKKDYEWYQFLVGHNTPQGVVATDVFFPDKATVYPGFLEVDGEMHAKASQALADLNKKHNLSLFTCGDRKSVV